MLLRGRVPPKSLATAVIDSFEFARSGGRQEVDIAVAGLERLRDLTHDSEACLHCSVEGERDRNGNACLVVRIDGTLNLRCQRCLAAMPWTVKIESRLLLVAPGAEWPDEELVEDGCDAIAADKELDLVPLFEDEVILALPLSPRHEVCELPAADADADEDRSPFAALAKLKQS